MVMDDGGTDDTNIEIFKGRIVHWKCINEEGESGAKGIQHARR